MTFDTNKYYSQLCVCIVLFLKCILYHQLVPLLCMVVLNHSVLLCSVSATPLGTLLIIILCCTMMIIFNLCSLATHRHLVRNAWLYLKKKLLSPINASGVSYSFLSHNWNSLFASYWSTIIIMFLYCSIVASPHLKKKCFIATIL